MCSGGMRRYMEEHQWRRRLPGPSLEGRTGIPGEKLSRDNKVFTYSAYYIAQMLFNVYMAARPDVMIVGGSVLNEDDLVR